MGLWHMWCVLSLSRHYLTEALINISWNLRAECSLYSWRGSEGAVMFQPRHDTNQRPLTPLQCSPCGLAEFTAQLSSGAEHLVSSAWSSKPNPFAYLAAMYPSGLRLDAMALSLCLYLVESLCGLLSYHLKQRRLVPS